MNTSSFHPLLDFDWIRQACHSPNLSVADCLKEQDWVGPNALFDTQYYRAAYGADIPRGMTCLEHFCRQTKESPRNPNPLYSTKQWHESIGDFLPNPHDWLDEFVRNLGAEARFSRKEMLRHQSKEAIVEDSVLGQGPAPGQEICLFIHFDRHNDIQPYVVDYLDALLAQGVCIFFLTNCHFLLPSAKEHLHGRVWRLVCSSNRAYDWGLYSLGVNLLKDQFAGHPVILTNDSVVGTMNSLDPLFAKARSGEADITGAIDAWLHHWHLQSFFLYCNAKAVRSFAWKDFWIKYRPHHDKWFVINSHEFGFSRWMKQNGLSMQAAWEYNRIVDRATPDTPYEWRNSMLKHHWMTNPTTELWDLLLEAGFPFLKRWIFNNQTLTNNLSHMCNIISKLSIVAAARNH